MQSEPTLIILSFALDAPDEVQKSIRSIVEAMWPYSDVELGKPSHRTSVDVQYSPPNPTLSHEATVATMDAIKAEA